VTTQRDMCAGGTGTGQAESQLALLNRIIDDLNGLGAALEQPKSWFEPWLAFLFLADPDDGATVPPSGGGFDGAE